MSQPGVGIDAAKTLKGAYQRFFNTHDGKAVLADLIIKCHVNETTFHENANVAAYQEGQRSVFVHLQAMADLDIEKLKSIRQP